MREFSSFLLSLLCLVAAVTLSSQAPVINVWPQPTSVSWTEPAVVPLSPLFRALPPIPDHPYLRAAVRRCAYTLLHERHQQIVPPTVSLAAAPPLRYLSVSVADGSAPLAHGADESYTLDIVSGLANLTARTAWGAMRGLETLAQLAWGADQVVIPTDIFIADRPLFPHRGLLLDTSRNFYPVGDVMRTIRAMAYNKMNVFHWHISDSQSFPLLLPSVPELAIKGSYGPKMRYSATDVRRVVRYAMRRGVRVIPEFDAPGHTGSWAGAYPEIVTCADKFWSPPGGPLLAAEPGTGQLNPLHPKTYEVVSKVHGDAADLFPDPFFHAGVDEVAPACWASDPTIQAFLSHGGTDDQLLEIFINTTHPHLVSLNRTVVYWEDVLLGPTVKVDPSLLPTESTVIQAWNKGPTNTKRITAAGYRVIVSSSDFYYLDCGHGGWVGNDSRYDKQVSDDPGRPFNYAGGDGGSWCAPFKSWQRVYDYDITHGLSAEEAARVVGGEVALWSEQADAAVVDERIWPRAAAMAEALWSGNRDASGKKRYAAATDRLNEWRHRMLRRGIRAEPIQPLWCMLHPGMCNLVQ